MKKYCLTPLVKKEWQAIFINCTQLHTASHLLMETHNKPTIFQQIIYSNQSSRVGLFVILIH
jgi:S-methylmethionine-dependent homocysteine/selenocysteine methylase